MAAEELLRDLPRTEDSRRLVLEWLDGIEGERNEEWTGETGKTTPEEEPSEYGSTASRGGPHSEENGSTASRGGPPSDENGSTVIRGGPTTKDRMKPTGTEQKGEGSTAIRGGPPKKDKGTVLYTLLNEAHAHRQNPLSEDTQSVPPPKQVARLRFMTPGNILYFVS